MLRTIAIAATALCTACPSPRPATPVPAPDDRALRIRIAQAEARRAGGVAELVQLAHSPDAHARALAVRGLGRTGGADALAAIVRATDDASPEVEVTALEAIGIAASLDDPPYFTLDATPVLVRAVQQPAAAEAAITALGRAGDASAQPVLVEALGRPDVAEVAALALARMGRRKIAWTPEARAAVIVATRSPDARVRYAATYALGREHEPPADESAAAALRDRLTDDAETRAQAIAGLAKRKAAKLDELIGYLRDRDWRVAVEAVRAVAADPDGQRALAVLVAVAPDQVAEEALRQLAATGLDEYARTLLAKSEPELPGWRGCFARAVLREPRVGCTGVDLAIVADVAKASPDDAWRRGAVRSLLESGDLRLRYAAFPYLGAPQLVAALMSATPGERGPALDAIGDRFSGDAAVEAAIIERARVETDDELSADLFAQIGQRKLAAGTDACRAGLSGHPVRARAAAECLRQLGEAVPPPPIGDATPPPVDVASVIGKHVRWHLETTRGAIDIELSPDDAPWNVATIVALTRKHFYDGLAFHRVVRDFVVQGGDPLQTGWGGPGFTTPAEPSAGARPEQTGRDAFPAPEFVAGGVGIADAGRDSGGSQFFIMQSRAAHLDGRYTWIGHVVSGQAVVDVLRIGDRVFSASVEIR